MDTVKGAESEGEGGGGEGGANIKDYRATLGDKFNNVRKVAPRD